MPLTQGTVVKKSKVISCERDQKNDYPNGKIPLYAFSVAMENGDKGTYKAKDPSKPKFVVGQEVEYFLDVMTSDKNPDWKSYILRYNSPNHKEFGFKKKSPEEIKSIIFNVTYSECLKMFIKSSELFNNIPNQNAYLQSIFNNACERVFKDGVNMNDESILSSSAIKLGILQTIYNAVAKEDTSEFDLEKVIKNIEVARKLIDYNRFKPKDANN